jgi:hypothetical protein
VVMSRKKDASPDSSKFLGLSIRPRKPSFEVSESRICKIAVGVPKPGDVACKKLSSPAVVYGVQQCLEDLPMMGMERIFLEADFDQATMPRPTTEQSNIPCGLQGEATSLMTSATML